MIKTIKENIVFSNQYFTVFNNDVEYDNEVKGVHIKMESANKQDGIAVLPVLKNGNILLIKNYRYSVDKFLYQVVKGGNGTKFTNMDLALQCVKEELEEEANKMSDDILYTGSFYESPSLLALKGESFIAFNCTEVIDKKYYQEDSECIESIVEINVNDIEDFMKDKETCSTTAYLLSEYKNYLLVKKIEKINQLI